MNLVEAVKSGFQKYATGTGRAPRSEYWYWALFCVILGFVTAILDIVIFGVAAEGESQFSPINTIASLVTFIPGICVGIRRMHDVNRSGWWILLPITIIGIIPFFIWAVTKGTTGENKYGSDPLA